MKSDQSNRASFLGVSGATVLGLLVAWTFGCSGSGAGRVPGAADPEALLPRPAAERYVLELVNRDRVEHGLARVDWDPTAAQSARRHAEDMCRRGFTAHWGSDGSTPESRYTESGGADMVQENAAGFSDGETRALEVEPKFHRRDLEQIQTAFIDEVPPQDGHRRNVLEVRHNRLGVGLARPDGLNRPCLVQEFADRYGAYVPLPRSVRVGQAVRVAGELFDPVRFGGIGVARVTERAPDGAARLSSSDVYRIPEPYILYFPKGFQSPQTVELKGPRFAIELPLSDNGALGDYEISVWGRFPGSDQLAMVSIRTVRVTP